MKTLFLHIGTPKTATTSLQHFFKDNHEILGKNNVFSRLIRTPMNLKNRSCGYSLFVKSDFAKAIEILSRNGIAYIGTAAVDAE